VNPNLTKRTPNPFNPTEFSLTLKQSLKIELLFPEVFHQEEVAVQREPLLFRMYNSSISVRGLRKETKQ
jgi:hypothetical protein